MKKTFSAVAIIAFLIVTVALSVSFSVAAIAEEPLSVEQTKKVCYCGADYLATDGKLRNFGDEEYENALYSALEIRYDGNVLTDINPSQIVFNGGQKLLTPNSYVCKVTVTVDDVPYTVTTAITIDKKDLYVRAKINGINYCVIDEGDYYRTSVEYEGFVGDDDETSLEAPAIIQLEPKTVTTGYVIVPELCSSSLYNIIYEGATIVIKANPDTERRYTSGGADVLILRGSFNPYYKLEFFDVGLNKGDSKYAAINEKAEKYFDGNRVSEEYEQANAYVINMYMDGEYVTFSESINVRLKIPTSLQGKKSYRIMHFYRDGTYEFLNAVELDGGYVSFNTSDLGEFLLLTPIEGANTVTIIAVSIGIVGGVLLLVLLFAIFRRKY